jgi:MerR family transcriptional regulator, light-induced transcriptional regulator
MRSLKTREAASLLNVSPNTLRTWERKFGYPKPLRSPGRHRAYTYAEIVALRDALRRGLSVASAISVVREGLGADTDALVSALGSFDLPGADRAMEASLALRSMERSVDEVLLPALDDLRRRDGVASAKWAIARRWGVDWLGRAQRFAPPPDEGDGIVIGDASGGSLGSSELSIRALELYCRRGGMGVLLLPVEALGGLDEAIEPFEPRCVVVAGAQSSDEQVGRWAYAVRKLAGAPPVALYLRPTSQAARQPAPHELPSVPADAHRMLIELVAAGRRARGAALEDEANGFAQSG